MLKNHGAVEFKDVLESLDSKIFFVTQPWVTFGFNLATNLVYLVLAKALYEYAYMNMYLVKLNRVLSFLKKSKTFKVYIHHEPKSINQKVKNESSNS